MKTFKTLLLIPAFAALAVSCSNDTEALQPEQSSPAIVRATTEYTETPATRTFFGKPGTGEGGYKIISVPLTWNTDETTEYIDVAGFDDSGIKSGAFTAFQGVGGSRSENGKSMDFTGTYPVADNYAYFYPKDKFTYDSEKGMMKSTGIADAQIQDGNADIDQFQEGHAYITAVNRMYTDLYSKGTAFALHPQGAILVLDITIPVTEPLPNSDVIITLKSSKSSFINTVFVSYDAEGQAILTAGDDSKNEQTLTIQGLEDTRNSFVTGYMIIGTAPDFTGLQSASLTYSIKVSGGKTYEGSLGNTTGSANWEAGTCYYIAVEVR
jgi:hypothetical protein